MLLLLTFLLSGFSNAGANPAVSDTSSPKATYVVLNEIQIEGNLKTQERIILRELALHPGDTLFQEEEEASIRKDRNKIINTNLFVTVEVSLQRIESPLANLVIHVSERWYLFLVPIFELADRNFNEWWYERKRDLSRTQYGLRVSHKNFRGRNEQFTALVQLGFTRKFELSYDVPYLDKIQKHGLSIDVSFSENKSVAYQTAEHKLLYLQSERILRKRFTAAISLSRRNRFYITHNVGLRYHYHTIADSVAVLNPDYYLNGSTRQQYFQLSYGFNRDLRDAVAYPLHGSRTTLEITKSGLLPSDDVNQLDVAASYTRYLPLGKRFYLNNRLQGKLSLPTRQSYAMTRGLGYGQDFVRGYELYVIDGQAYGLLKSTLKRELFKTQKNIERIMPFKQFQTVPLAMYVNLYFDVGYVSNRRDHPENMFLTNEWIYGSGLGLDLVTFYNTVFRLDFSINKSFQKNIFIHFVKDI